MATHAALIEDPMSISSSGEYRGIFTLPFVIAALREFCRTWGNQIEITVGDLHFIKEGSAEEIGRAIAKWIRGRPL
jgi:hypothetical protein